MFETSQDIFYVAVAGSIALVAIFLCWTLYYTAMILRGVRSTLSRVTHIFEKVDALADYIREKLDSTSSYMGILLAGAKQVMEYVSERRASDSDRKYKSKK